VRRAGIVFVRGYVRGGGVGVWGGGMFLGVLCVFYQGGGPVRGKKTKTVLLGGAFIFLGVGVFFFFFFSSFKGIIGAVVCLGASVGMRGGRG